MDNFLRERNRVCKSLIQINVQPWRIYPIVDEGSLPARNRKKCIETVRLKSVHSKTSTNCRLAWSIFNVWKKKGIWDKEH